MHDAAATGVILLAAVPVLIWLYLLLAHAGFWRVQRHLPPANLPHIPRRVAVVIPARDEAATIAATVASLLQQTLLPIAVIVVDDNSSDHTAELARQAGAQVLPGKPLPPGWTGKLWALAQGTALAEQLHPDYLLFTDADIAHGQQSLQQLAAIAETGWHDLVSFMVKLHCGTLAEKTLIPAFVFFFLLLYPPGRVAGAAGGCILIRPQALRRIGGLSAIASEVIDDCALARAVTKTGGSVWLGLTETTRSIRPYGTFAEIGRMISRSAFNQLHHSALLLLSTAAGLVATYLLPIALLFSGRPLVAALGALAWLLMAAAYRPMVRFYGLSVWWSMLLPGIATFYLGATVHSAIRYWRGTGGVWKGRVQDARSSRDTTETG